MRTELEPSDIQAIVAAVVQQITPVLAGGLAAPRKEVLDVQEMADYLGVEASWIYKQVQYKAIPHTKVGKYLRFRLKEMDKWLGELSVPAVSTTYPQLVTARAAATRRQEGMRKAA